MTIKIEEGKFYKTRSGMKVGPAKRETSDAPEDEFNVPWPVGPYYYSAEGKSCIGCEEDDIVAEWPMSNLTKHRRMATLLACGAMYGALGKAPLYEMKGPGGEVIVPFTPDYSAIADACEEADIIYLYAATTERMLHIQLRWGLGTGEAVGAWSESLPKLDREPGCDHIDDLFEYVQYLDI